MSGKLSIPERLLIDRRRRGETQASAAERCGVSNTRYSRFERGLDEVPPTLIPSIANESDLKQHELCLIARRREGWTQGELAQRLDRCKMTVRQMERGEIDCTELANYWGV